MRSRSFSWRNRAISEAWSADIGVACVVGRHAAAAGSCRNLSTQRRSTESRRPSSLATDATDRRLDTTNSTAWRLYAAHVRLAHLAERDFLGPHAAIKVCAPQVFAS